jgi:hypothetical protein
MNARRRIISRGMGWLALPLKVSGKLRWYLQSGDVVAEVRLKERGRRVGTLAISWNVYASASATISGTISGKAVRAQRIAP